MSRQGIAGWALLAVALAVPAAMFYRWRSGMQSAQGTAISKIARERIPAGGVFLKSPQQIKFTNPLDAQAPKMQPNFRPADVSSANQSVRISSTASQSPENPAAARAPSKAALAYDPSPGSYAMTVNRDPTLSPGDYDRLWELEKEKERKLHPVKKIRKIRRRPPVESTVHLEGIIYSPGNAKAIVNDETVGLGGVIGRVKVIRIMPNSVVFKYKNKTFIKTISR
ncbi:MAG: hypothetical protein ACYCPQ_01330 [Elusimicrobiota bacterium]